MSTAELFAAVKAGDIPTIRDVLARGANINATVKGNKNTPLIVAIQSKNIDVVRLLLDSGADKDKPGNNNNTPLVVAINNNAIDIIKLLIESGADINKGDAVHKTPLHAAIDGHKKDIIKLLIEKGVDVNKLSRLDTPLISAIINGNKAIIKMLLDAGADINDGVPLIRIIIIIISGIADLDENNINIIKLLIEKGADVSARTPSYLYTGEVTGLTPLMLASFYDSKNLSKILIDAGAHLEDKNNNDETALLVAFKKLHFDMANFLISKGANVNVADKKNGFTPLMYAVGHGKLETLNLLLEKGANITAKDNYGNSVLSTAAYNKRTEAVKRLLELNPPIDNKVIEGIKTNVYTPEITAMIKDHYKGMFKEEKWKGFTRSDIARLDTIFSDGLEASNYSYCPICLKYVERSEACNYMTHKCDAGGDYYHTELYNKYKNRDGYVSWCTICGRICVGHNHYPVVAASAPKPYPIVAAHDPFARDCRGAAGGGGLPEKLARFRQLRETALQLQKEVGKIADNNARDELVVESWNAPLLPTTRKLRTIETGKSWNYNTNLFPSNANNTAAPAAPVGNANDPTKYSAPVILSPGVGAAGEGRNANYQGNYITGEDDVPVIVFKHKDKDGNDRVHPQIGKEMLLDFLDGAGERLGKCFDDSCGGLLYPREIELAFADPKMAPTITDDDRARLAKYKERFGRWHAKGGRRRTKRARSAQRSAHRTLHSKSHVSKRTRRIKRSHK